MNFEDVLNLFDDYLKIDSDLEIIKCKRGYIMIYWDLVSGRYEIFDLSVTPRELFEHILEHMDLYYLLKYTNKKTNLISQTNQEKIEKILNKYKNKYIE